MSDLYYDDATHRYYAGDNEWPSVTGIIKHAGHLSHLRASKRALAKGTSVHDWTVLIDQGDLDDPTGGVDLASVPEWVRGEVKAYVDWRQWARPVWHLVEEARWHERWRFAGRPDRVGKFRGLPGEEGVMEIKTGSESRWHGLQTAGYQLLTGGGGRYVLYLQKNGRYAFRQHSDPGDYVTFRRDLLSAWEDQSWAQ